jgi:hydrogenase-4 component E
MNTSALDSMLVVVLLLNFYCLGTSRLRAVVKGVSLQGVLLGVMPLLVHHDLELPVVAIAIATIALKGLVIPAMLFRTLRDLPIRREVEPMLGFITSLVLGALGTGLAIAFAASLPIGETAAPLIVPASLSTVLTGFLLLITRRKAITQVVGYLMLENGVFIFGLLLIEALPVLVEAGVLLDLFVAIFVMGIMMNHISREFSSLSTERLTALKE